LPYKITAERDNETMHSQRSSVWIAVAKGRVWASEGWRVVITDDHGRPFRPEQFDELAAFPRTSERPGNSDRGKKAARKAAG
jgi:hypothetical protein